MNIKKTTKDLIKYGLKNRQSRKRAVQSALAVISFLNSHEGKDVSAKELNRVVGGEESEHSQNIKQKLSDNYEIYCS